MEINCVYKPNLIFYFLFFSTMFSCILKNKLISKKTDSVLNNLQKEKKKEITLILNIKAFKISPFILNPQVENFITHKFRSLKIYNDSIGSFKNINKRLLFLNNIELLSFSNIRISSKTKLRTPSNLQLI